MANRTVYLVRHGCTRLNSQSDGPERERGWSDVSLDAAGRKEAIRIAAKLSNLGIRALLSSDLKRAKQTADIIADYLGLDPEFYRDLRTWDTGSLAGKLKSQSEPIIAGMVRHHPDEARFGAESFNAFCRRIRDCLNSVLGSHTENPLAIVIHHRVERLIEAADAGSWDNPDLEVFLAKGENPGTIEKWTPNLSALSSGSQKSRKVSSSAAGSANTSRAGNAITPSVS